MAQKGLLINYDLCCGRHSCEIACKQELDPPAGENGIHVFEFGPAYANGKLVRYFFPMPTDSCNGCAGRLEAGLHPSCAKHCVSGVIDYGDVAELAEKMNKSDYKQVLWNLK
ncbi:MAG: oxidoreductase [Candidatus Hydrogenedentes bacterium]|nr:oxidoreductase [Candidatus Hydrogenedentota bacterium]